ADRTFTETFHSERRYYGTFPDENQLAETSAFLRAELAPQYKKLREIQQRRFEWYTEHIPNNLDQILDTVESLYPNGIDTEFHDVNRWTGIVIIPDGVSIETYANEHGFDGFEERYVVHEADLDDHTSPTEYGISLPAPLLAGEYNSQSRYSL